MLESLIDAAFSLLLIVGLPALFVFFVLKGALVGKPLPTSVLLPGYALAISASRLEILGIVLVSSTGYVCGQLVVYYGSRRSGLSFLQSAPRVRVPESKIRRAELLLGRYGGPAIFVTNFVPYLRGLIMIPAGIAAYPVTGVVVYTFSSTFIYHVALVVFVIEIAGVLL